MKFWSFINLSLGPREVPHKIWAWSVQVWWKMNFDGDKYLKFWSFINLPWGNVRSHTKFGPDRFRFDEQWILMVTNIWNLISRFDVYWISYLNPILWSSFLLFLSPSSPIRSKLLGSGSTNSLRETLQI